MKNRLLLLIPFQALLVSIIACGDYRIEETEQFKKLQDHLVARHQQHDQDQLNALHQLHQREEGSVAIHTGRDSLVRYFTLFTNGESKAIQISEKGIPFSDITAADIQKACDNKAQRLCVQFGAGIAVDAEEIAVHLQRIDQALPTTVCLMNGTFDFSMFDITQPEVALR